MSSVFFHVLDLEDAAARLWVWECNCTLDDMSNEAVLSTARQANRIDAARLKTHSYIAVHE